MRTLTTALSFLISTVAFGQQCKCDKDTLLAEIIMCDTTIFDNNAKLFWSFNCDSSWLTFKNKAGQENIIFSLGDGLHELTGRLGYIYLREYKNSFLMQNNVISGCCSPPDYFLYDKSTGLLKRKLGRLIYHSDDRKNPFTVSVTNSNYHTKFSGDYNSLTIYNVDADKKYIIDLPKRQLDKALKETEQMYPEYLFEESVIKGNTLIIKYYLSKKTNDKRTITINLKKYSS